MATTVSTAEFFAARVATLLEGLAPAGGVHRDRHDAFTREESPAIVVEIVSEQTTGHASGPLTDRSDTVVQVVYLTRSEGWQTVVDALRVAGHSLIQRDPQLNQQLQGLRRVRADWAAATADLQFGYCAQQYTATHVTPRAALSSPI